jgi:hypothetical protein
MTTADEQLVAELVERFPGLRDQFDEHVRDNEEVLPHVFFGDVTRYVLDLYRRSREGDSAARAELQALLAFLDERFAAGGPDEQNLLAVSFVENLPKPHEDDDGIRDLLGPHLSAELARIG